MQRRYSEHARTRMLALALTVDDVNDVIARSDVIEVYGEDRVGGLLWGMVDARVIHVSLVVRHDLDCRLVTTVYAPDPEDWDETMRLRR